MLTLASDFGSPYPAAMKGKILSRTDAQLVDVTHDLARQDVRAAAFWLREVLPTFPPAVHLAVVDPGVGTDRAVLALTAGDHVLVGPDNGLLLPAARRLADDISAYNVAYDDPASTTFHGRDVFAPLAAEIHDRGAEILAADDRFTPTHDYETITFPEPDSLDGAVRGEVLVVDEFGNAITNVPGSALDGHAGSEVVVNGDSVPARRTYAAVEPGQRLVTVGSHDNVELAVNRGRGEDGFGVGSGDRVLIETA